MIATFVVSLNSLGCLKLIPKFEVHRADRLIELSDQIARQAQMPDHLLHVTEILPASLARPRCC